MQGIFRVSRYKVLQNLQSARRMAGDVQMSSVLWRRNSRSVWWRATTRSDRCDSGGALHRRPVADRAGIVERATGTSVTTRLKRMNPVKFVANSSTSYTRRGRRRIVLGSNDFFCVLSDHACACCRNGASVAERKKLLS